jgi:glycolate oxidase FAD binding subunit
MSQAERPEREGEVERIVRSACADGAKLDVVGGDALEGYGRAREGARRLSMAALSETVFYAPSEMTICAQAGATLDSIEAVVAQRGQMLPFEPMRPRALFGGDGEPTLGGVVATNLSGPRRVSAGAVRDSVLGLRLVNGLGQTIRCGGRVMKNVTGLDLTKLNCGANGTLGVLTEVTLKLQPKPETETTLIVSGLDPEQAVEAMTAALGSPYGVSGAAWVPAWMGETLSLTALRLEGFAESVTYRAGRLTPLMQAFGETRAIEFGPSQALWRSIRDAEHIAEPRERAIWRVSLAPSEAPGFVLRLGATALARSFDWGGGLVWLATDETEQAASSVRGAIPPGKGHATLMRASHAFRMRVAVFQPPTELELKLARGVKASFDPGAVLNFGRIYAGV